MIHETYYSQATEQEKAIYKDWLSGMLRAGPVTITFTKKDGTQREMLCTLQEGVMVPYVSRTGAIRAKNDEVCKVWDIAENVWRSFRYDSICIINIDLIGQSTTTA